MTAPETTAAIQVGKNPSHLAQVTVASINTSVTFVIEGSVDGTGWFNLDPNNSSQVVTANGVYAYKTTARIKFWRLRWSAEAGGAAATLDVIYYGSTQ